MGGLWKDGDPTQQPEGTYSQAQNWLIRMDGLLEQDTFPKDIAQLPMPMVGSCALDTEQILFLHNGEVGEVGIFDGAAYKTFLSSKELKLSSKVSATARIDYQGHRLVYFADGVHPMRWLDLDAPVPANLETGIDLITNPKLPRVKLKEVGENGSLVSGIVFIGARLLTDSKNTTPISLLTAPIPITDDPFSSPKDYDGAPLGTPTNKSISVTVNNIAAGYKYAQLVVVRFLGLAGSLDAYSLPPVSISGKEELTLSYFSDTQHQEKISAAELLAEYNEYDVAQMLHQKDGILLAAGVGRSEQEQAISWQKVANSIRFKKIIKSEVYTDAIDISVYNENSKTGGVDTASSPNALQGYQKPELTGSKSLHRSEVYAFSFTPVYNNKLGEAYHIPAPYAYDGGTFFSGLFYPEDGDYPGEQGIGRTQIRHFRMPSAYESPILKSEFGVNSLQILGLEIDVAPDTSFLSDKQKGKLTGYVIGICRRTDDNKTMLAQGIYQNLYRSGGYWTPVPYSGRYAPGSGINEETVSRSNLAFYSPETVILQKDVSSARYIGPTSTISGSSFIVADKRTGTRKEQYAHLFFNYDKVAPAYIPGAELISSSTKYVVNNGSGEPVQLGEDRPFSTLEQNGYLHLKLKEANSLAYYGGRSEVVFTERSGKTSEIYLQQADGSYKNQDDAKHRGVTSRSLVQLWTTKPNQYGAVDQMTYMPVLEVDGDGKGLQFFPGDTFIGRFAVMATTAERQDDGQTSLTNFTYNYFFCESSVNLQLRHYALPSANAAGTQPYYPKIKQLWNDSRTGLMQLPKSLGHPTGYNQQYSFQNNLQPLLPKDTSVSTVEDLPNRIIYSAQSVDGEQLDAFRIFLPNNYHDLPKNKGKITNMFTLSGSLHVHTERSLWKAFFNQATTQTTSEGEVYLGNGGLFPRPSVELLTVDGGYAGCKDSRSSVLMEQGYCFVDVFTKKIFLYQASLNEVSKLGLYNYFTKTISTQTTYQLYHERDEKRILLTGLPDGAISYSLLSGKWTAQHPTNKPAANFSREKAYVVSVDNMLSLSSGGQTMPSALQLITNTAAEASKVFETARMLTAKLPKTFSWGTQSQDTETLVPILHTAYGQEAQEGQILLREANNQFQISLPRDKEGGRIRGKWAATNLAYAGLDNQKAVLKMFIISFRASIR